MAETKELPLHIGCDICYYNGETDADSAMEPVFWVGGIVVYQCRLCKTAEAYMIDDLQRRYSSLNPVTQDGRWYRLRSQNGTVRDQ